MICSKLHDAIRIFKLTQKHSVSLSRGRYIPTSDAPYIKNKKEIFNKSFSFIALRFYFILGGIVNGKFTISLICDTSVPYRSRYSVVLENF